MNEKTYTKNMTLKPMFIPYLFDTKKKVKEAISTFKKLAYDLLHKLKKPRNAKTSLF